MIFKLKLLLENIKMVLSFIIRNFWKEFDIIPVVIALIVLSIFAFVFVSSGKISPFIYPLF